MKLQVFYNFISFFILKIVVECPKDIFLIEIYSMQRWIVTTRHGVTKRITKRLKHTGNLFTENLQLVGAY